MGIIQGSALLGKCSGGFVKFCFHREGMVQFNNSKGCDQETNIGLVNNT